MLSITVGRVLIVIACTSFDLNFVTCNRWTTIIGGFSPTYLDLIIVKKGSSWGVWRRWNSTSNDFKDIRVLAEAHLVFSFDSKLILSSRSGNVSVGEGCTRHVLCYYSELIIISSWLCHLHFYCIVFNSFSSIFLRCRPIERNLSRIGHIIISGQLLWTRRFSSRNYW